MTLLLNLLATFFTVMMTAYISGFSSPDGDIRAGRMFMCVLASVVIIWAVWK